MIIIIRFKDASLEDVSAGLKKSFVKDSTFHKCWNSAIATQHTYNHEISGNVIYEVVTDAIVVNGDATGVVITNNLISKVIWPVLHAELRIKNCIFVFDKFLFIFELFKPDPLERMKAFSQKLPKIWYRLVSR